MTPDPATRARAIVEKALHPYGAPSDLTHRERLLEAAFDAVLTEQNAALARVERQLAEADAVIAGHWQGHANDGQTWRLEDQARPVREAIVR